MIGSTYWISQSPASLRTSLARDIPALAALANSGLVPGSYTNVNVTVGPGGNLTAISSGAGGGALTLTDGTHTVTGTTQITVTGATVGGATPNATLAVTGGGSGTVTSVALSDGSTNPIYTISGSPVSVSGTLTETLNTQTTNTIFAGPATGAAAQPAFRAMVASDLPYASATPATIPDLIYWLKADLLTQFMSTSGAGAPVLPNMVPWWTAEDWVSNVSAGFPILPKYNGNTLNGLGVLDFIGNEHFVIASSVAGATVNNSALCGFNLKNSTIFAVLKATNVTGSTNGYSIISGGPSGVMLEFRVAPAGGLDFTDGAHAAVGTTGLISNGNWYQLNGTFNGASSGAYAFRIARAAAGSGASSTVAPTQASNALLWYRISAVNLDWVGSVAEIIIYNRVLSGTEITNVETYLHTKWGV